MEKTNLNEVLESIYNEAIDSEKMNKKYNDLIINKIEKKRNKIMSKVWLIVLKKFLGKLKVKITIYWDEKEIFEYVIPKN